jgi:uncharacterized membrane protein YraQ (UPF0718 family)
VHLIRAIGHAAETAGSMSWQILWALVFGFYLSAIVEALVRKDTIARLLGNHRPKGLAVAAGLGAASSSCSYAAVALARSLIRKGADFVAAMAFQIASTNLVIELGIILAVLVGWQFTLAEFVGGPIMIILVALAFRVFVPDELIDQARIEADRGAAGRMEGHAAMDMSVTGEGPFWRRLVSSQGFTSTSHIYFMNWASVIVDVAGGLLIAGCLAAWVPESFWRHLFFVGHPAAAEVLGPLIGPAISLVAFVCSIGNVPLAAVLWNGGMSFGGIVSFIFADLIIVPILLIYRKYYGNRMALRLFAIFYATMSFAGYIVEAIFDPLGLVPTGRQVRALQPHISLDSDTYLNIVAILLTAILLVRFLRSGGGPMLRMMGGSADGGHQMGTGDHDHHGHGGG